MCVYRARLRCVCVQGSFVSSCRVMCRALLFMRRALLFMCRALLFMRRALLCSCGGCLCI